MYAGINSANRKSGNLEMRSVGIRGRDASNRARRMRALLAGTALSALTALPAAAQDATWLLNPGTGNFNTAANWTPAAVPTGVATFGVSNTTAVSFSASTIVGAWTFNAGASNYTFTNANALTFDGAGISVFGGSATIVSNGIVRFLNSSTAGTATITNNAGLFFAASSTAGNAIINNNSGAGTTFSGTSSAGNATILNAGSGVVGFVGASTGGTARLVNTNAAAQIDLSGLTASFLNVGSIEGVGQVQLGSKALGVGFNNGSTDFSGVISGAGGSLNKFGNGTLTLSGVNTYTGVTGVTEGTLLVAASGLIAAPSQAAVALGATLIVNGIAGDINLGGTLSGTGTVGFTVINGGATFAPGSGVAGSTMTVANGINFLPGATYRVQISPTAASSASVTGGAGLAGTVNAQFAAGNYVARNYTILTSVAPPSTRLARPACLPASPPAWATLAITCCSISPRCSALEQARRSIATSRTPPTRSTNSLTMGARCRRLLSAYSG
jgi:autotransporter-associated beta strand protein